MPRHVLPFLRYAIYTRQSVDRGDDVGSCDAQFAACRDAARAAGGPNLHWIVRRFDDVGCSGATIDRPAMRRLRKVIDLGGIDCLYAVALDRLSRNMRDAITLLDELDRAGVELRLVYQPELTSGAEHHFLRNMLAAFAEFERDMIAARIADHRAYLKAHGRRLAGKVPYGYDADRVTRQLVPYQVEAGRVRQIFQWVADGQLPREIAEHVNRRGWRTKVYRARRTGKATGGGVWTARAVLDVLHNPVYLGRFADGARTRHGCHEAIVDDDTFDAVQRILEERRTTTKPRRKRTSSDSYLFRQKIVCPRCGRFLATYQVSRKSARGPQVIHLYYRCRSTAGGWPRCRGVQYRAIAFETAAREMLDDVETWQAILGDHATKERADAARAAWQTMPWAEQRDFMRQSVERITVHEEDSEISVSFSAEVQNFLARSSQQK